MLARGFGGTLRGPELARPVQADLIVFGVLMAVIAALTTLAVLWGPGP